MPGFTCAEAKIHLHWDQTIIVEKIGMKILMVYPEFPDTFWSFKHAIKFVGKKACNPPLGLITIAAMVPEDWEIKLVDTNIEPLEDQDILNADLVLISAMDVQRNSVHTIARQCKRLGATIVAGGPLFTGEYQDFPEIDYFVLNEGEITFPEFLKDWMTGDARRVYETKEYAEITKSPLPRYELLKLSAYDSMGIQFSRGCPYNCDFCNVTALLGHKPRIKTADQIIAELDYLYRLGWRRNIFFVDDNFIGNKKILKSEILPAIIQWKKGKKGCLFVTEASVNLADDDELMNLMAAAGFINIFVGIETPDEAALQECNKKQNSQRDLLASVHKMQEKGFQVMAGFIVGFDSDSENIFDRQVEFIQKSGIIAAMVGMLQAPYGTSLYERLKSEGRILKEMSGDNADGTTNIIPLMDAEKLRSGYFSLLSRINAYPNFYQRVDTFLDHYKPLHHPVTLQWAEIQAFLRSIVWIGLAKEGKRQYWRLFFRTLLKYPSKFPLAITLAIYGYHFRKIIQVNAQQSALQPMPTHPAAALPRIRHHELPS